MYNDLIIEIQWRDEYLRYQKCNVNHFNKMRFFLNEGFMELLSQIENLKEWK